MESFYITLETHLSLTESHHDRICAVARLLNLPEDEVIRSVVNTAVRRLLDSVQEVSE